MLPWQQEADLHFIITENYSMEFKYVGSLKWWKSTLEISRSRFQAVGLEIRLCETFPWQSGIEVSERGQLTPSSSSLRIFFFLCSALCLFLICLSSFFSSSVSCSPLPTLPVLPESLKSPGNRPRSCTKKKVVHNSCYNKPFQLKVISSNTPSGLEIIKY